MATKKQEIGRETCPTCGSPHSSSIQDHEQAKIICEECGRILEEGIKDRGPEWRAFDQKQKEERSRAGPPTTETIHDKGLSTQIDYRNRDHKGKSLSPKERRRAYSLRKWHKRSKMFETENRNLATAFSEINRMSSQLSLGKSVQEEASIIYRGAVEEGLIRGRSIEGVASAALWAACKVQGIPRSLDEITEVSYVDRNEVTRSYRMLDRESEQNFPRTDAKSYVSSFGSELDLSGETRAKAIEIIRGAEEEGLTSGRSPTGIAAAGIYAGSLKTGERRTQREVAEVAGVTEVTLRNRYKEMNEILDLDLEAY